MASKTSECKGSTTTTAKKAQSAVKKAHPAVKKAHRAPDWTASTPEQITAQNERGLWTYRPFFDAATRDRRDLRAGLNGLNSDSVSVQGQERRRLVRDYLLPSDETFVNARLEIELQLRAGWDRLLRYDEQFVKVRQEAHSLEYKYEPFAQYLQAMRDVEWKLRNKTRYDNKGNPDYVLEFNYERIVIDKMRKELQQKVGRQRLPTSVAAAKTELLQFEAHVPFLEHIHRYDKHFGVRAFARVLIRQLAKRLLRLFKKFPVTSEPPPSMNKSADGEWQFRRLRFFEYGLYRQVGNDSKGMPMGNGMRTAFMFDAHTTIGPYAGRKIYEKAFDIKAAKKPAWAREVLKYLFRVGKGVLVDPFGGKHPDGTINIEVGHALPFFNEPPAISEPNFIAFVDGKSSRSAAVFYKSLRVIHPGERLFVAYGPALDRAYSPSDKCGVEGFLPTYGTDDDPGAIVWEHHSLQALAAAGTKPDTADVVNPTDCDTDTEVTDTDEEVEEYSVESKTSRKRKRVVKKAKKKAKKAKKKAKKASTKAKKKAKKASTNAKKAKKKRRKTATKDDVKNDASIDAQGAQGAQGPQGTASVSFVPPTAVALPPLRQSGSQAALEMLRSSASPTREPQNLLRSMCNGSPNVMFEDFQAVSGQ